MKSFVALLAVVAVVAADVAHIVRSPETDAQILRQEADVLPDQYQYAYETSNGISAQENGQLRSNPEGAAIAVQGANGYTSPEGQRIETSYIADENGYQPQGAHLPTPPPTQAIPDYIIKSLEYIRTHAPQPELVRRP